MKKKPRYRSSFLEDEICDFFNCDVSLKKDNSRTDRRLCEKHRKLASVHSLMDGELVELFSRYEGKCHICKVADAVVIDHDKTHCVPDKTYKIGCAECVRGALCKSCNLGLGYFKDDAKNLLLATEYLDNFEKL